MTGGDPISKPPVLRAMADALVARFGDRAAEIARQQRDLAEGAISDTWTEILAMIEVG